MHIRRFGIPLSVLAGLLTLAGALALLGAWDHGPVLAREPVAAPAVAPAAGGIRYVALSGDDASNDCTQPLAPCRTLQHAIDRAAPGDEVRVAAGVYTDCAVRPAPSGYSGSPTVTQVAYITQSLTLRGGFTATDWLTYNPISYPTTLDAQQQGRVILIAGGVSVTVEGLRITGGGAVDRGVACGLEMIRTTLATAGITVTIEDPPVSAMLFATVLYPRPAGGAQAVLTATTTLVTTPLAATFTTSHTVVSGDLHAAWTTDTWVAAQFATLTVPYARLYDAHDTLLAAGPVQAAPTAGDAALALALGEGLTCTVDGRGALSFYAPATTGLGVGGTWETYTASVAAPGAFGVGLQGANGSF